MLTELRQIEEKVLRLRLDGLTMEEVGVAIGRTTIASRCLVDKARRKLRRRQFSEYLARHPEFESFVSGRLE